jgi:hypothetical protein
MPSTSLEDLITGRAPEHGLVADPLAEIERILELVKAREIAGVISSDDYPGSALAAAVAERLGLPAPDPRSYAHLPAQISIAGGARESIVPDAVPPVCPDRRRERSNFAADARLPDLRQAE